ncbi:MAG TPA: hypothetical protein RMH99_19830 [Sandaracinaceae bacterium LLY-WYZ-13_1]|nr:hypothetical protein [Sandaracinaceae bacterium LLY-WYZ-13_1]
MAALGCRIYRLDHRRLSIYDTRTGEWSDGARAPHVSGSVSLTAANGRVYAVHSRRDVASYDPARDTWSDLPRLPGRNMSGTTPIAVDGALYAFGGEWRVIRPGEGLDEGTSRAAYVLRPGASEWEELPEMPTALAWSSAVLLGGLVWLVGGTNDGAASPAVLSFDPERREWAYAARLPRPCKCAATTLGGRLYVFGREIGDRLWGPRELDVESEEWRRLERRPHEETGSWVDAAVTVDDAMLVLTHSPEQLYRYDPGEDAWTRRHPPEAER